ncbi:MAG: thioredoxin family protein [Bdellovibrionaceae bacterium]|nr:thioredoxin family protein [Pseudobdellovibrionaceae bacterium]
MSIYFLFNFFPLHKTLAQENTDPLIITVKSIKESISVNENFQVELELNLPDGFHAYEDKFNVQILEPNGFKVGPLKLSPIKEWYDKFSKKNKTGVEKKSTLSFILEAPDRFIDAKDKLVIGLTYQACSDSFCLFPKTKDIFIKAQFVSTNTNTLFKQEPLKEKNFFTLESFNELLSQSWWLALIVAFTAGILTSFTPCIFPMIPITIAILTKGAEKKTRVANFITSLVYVHGIATTYSLFGLIAAYTGSLFGALLSNTYFLIFICALFLVMSFSMYGAFEMQVPAVLRNKFGNGSQKNGYLGAYISGLFAGLVASPCVGPVLVAILTYVSTQKSLFFGFLLLFTYAMGMGLLFLILGAFSELAKKLPRSGPWMEFMKFILGSLMLSAFFYYFNFLVSSRVYLITLGISLVILASLYGAFMPISASLHGLPRKRDYLRKGFMQALLVLGLTSLVIGVFNLKNLSASMPITTELITAENDSSKVKWQLFSNELLQKASQEGKPVIIDFYADWCAACLELEMNVFSKIQFKQATDDFYLLKFDATKSSKELDELKKKFMIRGLPTILFYDHSGNWVKNKTLTEYESLEKFLVRIKDLKSSSNSL